MSTKTIALLITSLVLACFAAYAAVEHRKSDDCPPLAEDPVRWDHLVSQWQQNNVIMVLRHATKCDKDVPPCIDGNEILTQRGRLEAGLIGKGVQSSLMGEYIVSHSYLDRTREAALIAFGTSTPKAELSKSCKLSFEDYILSLETNMNHILVTHSSCINSLKRLDGERLIGFSTGKDPHFGIAAFLENKPEGKHELIGCLWPTNWADMPNAVSAD